VNLPHRIESRREIAGATNESPGYLYRRNKITGGGHRPPFLPLAAHSARIAVHA